MKNLFQLLLLLFTCGINAFAQSNETFTLSTDKPETRKDIGFFYSFSPTKMSRQFIYLIYQKGDHVQQISLQGKYSRGRIEGKFRLPDSVYSFRIQPDKRPNGTEVFIFQVHKKGEPVKGSYAATAQFYGKAGSGIRDVKKSLSLFRQEFALNPEQKPRYLLDYFSAGHFNPDSIILKELVQTAQDSIEHGTNETFLTKFYNIAINYGNVELNEKLKSHLLTKYPSGQLAFTMAEASFWDRYNKGDYLKTFWELERNFPEQIASGALDETYNLLIAPHNFLSSTRKGPSGIRAAAVWTFRSTFILS